MIAQDTTIQTSTLRQVLAQQHTGLAARLHRQQAQPATSAPHTPPSDVTSEQTGRQRAAWYRVTEALALMTRARSAYGPESAVYAQALDLYRERLAAFDALCGRLGAAAA